MVIMSHIYMADINICGVTLSFILPGLTTYRLGEDHTYAYYPQGLLIDGIYMVPWHNISYFIIKPEKQKEPKKNGR